MLHRERDAEVGDERLAVMQENVLGLDVAVDDAVAVRVVERARDFGRDAHRVVDREAASRARAGRAAISPSTYGMT